MTDEKYTSFVWGRMNRPQPSCMAITHHVGLGDEARKNHNL
ncbi:hypothetical protein SXCC_04292 [Gluconacetobacter sp. SXCC-1]|nr:hypothetical protein SXCC_04292 [Gluconacetobacter sp. SXCC-1]